MTPRKTFTPEISDGKFDVPADLAYITAMFVNGKRLDISPDYLMGLRSGGFNEVVWPIQFHKSRTLTLSDAEISPGDTILIEYLSTENEAVKDFYEGSRPSPVEFMR